jgi:uncharacterized protein (TIGR02285 family)
MIKFNVLIAAVSILGMLSVQSADAQSLSTDPDSPVLTWHIFDAPPLMILDGADKDNGIIDGIRHLLQSDLTTLTHEEMPLPYKRFLLYAKEKLNICTPYLFKTAEREDFLYFSKPVNIFAGLKIIMHKDLYASFGHEPSLSLVDLFKNYELRLATNKIRAYSETIDPIVKEYDRLNKVSRHTGSTTQVFRLLSTGRADFMIDFSYRVPYWAKELGIDPSSYVSIPIKEDSQTVISYAACPKTPWGEKMIAKINKALAEEVPTQTYLDVLKRWSLDFNDEELRTLHQQLASYYKKGPQE